MNNMNAKCSEVMRQTVPGHFAGKKPPSVRVDGNWCSEHDKDIDFHSKYIMMLLEICLYLVQARWQLHFHGWLLISMIWSCCRGNRFITDQDNLASNTLLSGQLHYRILNRYIWSYKYIRVLFTHWLINHSIVHLTDKF